MTRTRLIWIRQSEYQCCGEPLRRGEVRNLLVGGDDVDWLTPWPACSSNPLP